MEFTSLLLLRIEQLMPCPFTSALQRRKYLSAVLTLKVKYSQQYCMHVLMSLSLYIYIYTGVEHQIKFCCCDCESMCTTMVRARLWPASPRFPQLAFTFEVLDWAEALLLECHVAVGEFCRALYFKCPVLVKKVCTIIHCCINYFLHGPLFILYTNYDIHCYF